MTSIRVINFRITPYSDETAAFINNLSEKDIYYLFDHEKQADILTAALFAIYKLEFQLYQSLNNKSTNTSSWIFNQVQTQCTNKTHTSTSFVHLSAPILESLSLVYLRDKLLFEENINELTLYPNVFVMIVDRMYAGHVYAWTVDRVTNIVGIRSSIFQLLSNNCGLKQPQIAPIFLNAIYTWALSQIDDRSKDLNQRDHYLRFLQPSGQLPELLIRCGFISTRKIRNNRDTAWLFDNRTIGGTTLVNGLLFREKDYIVGISSPLHCTAPSYEYTQIL